MPSRKGDKNRLYRTDAYQWHFAMKFKGGFLNHECIVKFLKLIHKLDKNPKFTKGKKTWKYSTTRAT